LKLENSVDIAVASSSVVVNGSTSADAAGPQRNEIPKKITYNDNHVNAMDTELCRPFGLYLLVPSVFVLVAAATERDGHYDDQND
jgi:hypothetical protein